MLVDELRARHVRVFAPSIFWEIILEDSYLSSSLERLLATVSICKNTIFLSFTVLYLFFLYLASKQYEICIIQINVSTKYWYEHNTQS